MAWLLGWIWWTVLPLRKRLAVANHQAAFPDRDPGELRRTVGELAWSYAELLLGRRARVAGLEHFSGGAIALAGHFPGWDLALVSLAEQAPVTIFVREPHDALPRWVIRRLRARAGAELLPPRGSMARAYAALGQGRTVIFVQDQRHDGGLVVDFLGRPAKTSPALAAMAWRTRAPLVSIVQERIDGEWVATIRPLAVAVPADRDAAIAALTAESQRFYSREIRRRPWAWWWLHDRWR
jgi:KDO2-lipid IV(A) lauroyltransferase